jgi:heme-degrading monooxygenase HmoA
VHQDAPGPGPVVTVFRSRLRPGAHAGGYGELAGRMEARARAMPGFLDFKTFTAADGERVSIVVFDTFEHHCAWRADPEHRAAQRRGRDTFYAEYSISVCARHHHREFRHAPEPAPGSEPEPAPGSEPEPEPAPGSAPAGPGDFGHDRA